MSRRSEVMSWVAIAAIVLALVAGTTALGGPVAPAASPLALANKALKAAKKANKLSRQASAAAAKPKQPGPQGAKGATGPKGNTGSAGSPGSNGNAGQDASDGSPGKTASASKQLASGPTNGYSDSITVGNGTPAGSPDRRVHGLLTMQIQHSGSAGTMSCQFALDGGSASESQEILLQRILQEVVIQTSWLTNPGAHSVAFACTGGGSGTTINQGQLIAWTG